MGSALRTFLVFILHTVTGPSDLCSCAGLADSVLRAHPLKLCFCTLRTGLLLAMQTCFLACTTRSGDNQLQPSEVESGNTARTSDSERFNSLPQALQGSVY